jgi:hypothetical protein
MMPGEKTEWTTAKFHCYETDGCHMIPITKFQRSNYCYVCVHAMKYLKYKKCTTKNTANACGPIIGPEECNTERIKASECSDTHWMKRLVAVWSKS